MEGKMKKLLSVFLIMFIVCCGIAYANDYGVSYNEEAIEISELQGNSYSAVIILPPFMTMFGVFSFDESGNFIISILAFGEDFVSTSGNYTQTGSAFTAHCEYLGFGDIPHVLDCKGASILDTFIFGVVRVRPMGIGFFFGILSE
jgi:hypothetical protein